MGKTFKLQIFKWSIQKMLFIRKCAKNSSSISELWSYWKLSCCILKTSLWSNKRSGQGKYKIQSRSVHVCCVCLSLHPLGWAHSFWRFLGPQLGLHFFEFELKPTEKDSADPTQHEFKHHIVQARRNPSLNTGLEWSAKPLRHQPVVAILGLKG